MASVLDSGLGGPGWSTGRGTALLCSKERHFTLIVPLSTQVYKWVLANLLLRVTLKWTSISSRGSRNSWHLLHATETGISSSLIGYLARTQTLHVPLPYHYK